MSNIDKETFEDILKHNYSSEEIQELFGIDILEANSILDKINNKNIIKYNFKEINGVNKKHLLNITFFDKIDTEEKAYFLGLLYADGCNIRNGFSISLQEQDKYILEQFLKSLDSNSELSFSELSKKNLKHKNVYRLNIYSKYMSEALTKIGCVPKKSHILLPPSISSERDIVRHFIRGYFDGDGCISLKHGVTTSFLHFQIAGTLDMMKYIHDMFVKFLRITPRKISPIATIWQLNINKQEDIFKIYNFLYNGASIFLKRKKEKFESNLAQDRSGLTSKRKNVCFRKEKKCWRALYYKNGKRSEKSFPTEELAIEFLCGLQS